MGKRGPARKPGKRKNGRLTTEARQAAFTRQERETISVAMEARKRLFGLTDQRARDQLGGSVIGRMKQAGILTNVQYEAAMTYIHQAESYHKAMSGPKEPGAVDMNQVRGLSATDGQTQAKRDKTARQRYEAAKRAVQDAQNELRGTGNLWGALDFYLFRDYQAYNLEGDLKLALNALSRHYGLMGTCAA